MTSQTFLAKAGLEPLPGMVFLEDVLTSLGGTANARRLRARVPAAGARDRLVVPARQSRRRRHGRDHLLERQHRRAEGRDAHASQHPRERRQRVAGVRGHAAATCILGVLPFFHSFGFTGTLWFPLLDGFGAAYHPNPMDAKTIGELAAPPQGDPADQHADLLPGVHPQVPAGAVRASRATPSSAPKSCASRSRRRSARSSASICSRATAARRWRRSSRSTCRTSTIGAEHQIGTQAGSVGHPLPGVAAKIVDLDTGDGPLIDTRRPAARQGPESDARLPRRSGEDARRCCATAGT